MRNGLRLGSTLLLGLAGCLQAASTLPVDGQPGPAHHSQTSAATRGTTVGQTSGTSTGASSPVGGSTGAGSSSGSAGTSTASGGTGGSSGGSPPPDGGVLVCPAAAVPPEQVDCAVGTVPFAAQTVDLLQCTPVGDANITAVAPDGVPYAGIAAVSDPVTGAFGMCLPQSQAFTPVFTAAQYPTTYFSEFSGFGANPIAQVLMISQQEFSALGSLLPSSVVASDGFIIVKIVATALCRTMVPGWTVSLALPDGGAFPDGGYQLVYVGSTFVPDPTATSTSREGVAILYNIDTSISNFVVPVVQSPPDAGSCQPLNALLDLTGRVYVAADSASLYPIVIP